MRRKNSLPHGLTPRLLDRDAAATYCGVSVPHFLEHVPVDPVEIGKKKLWDRMMIDRWLDSSQSAGQASPDQWNQALDEL